MDRRLSQQIDDDQVWQICQICTEWTRKEDLALDPDDGLRWDICQNCDNEGNATA